MKSRGSSWLRLYKFFINFSGNNFRYISSHIVHANSSRQHFVILYLLLVHIAQYFHPENIQWLTQGCSFYSIYAVFLREASTRHKLLCHLLTPALVGRLVAYGQYFGMKDCTGDLSRLVAMADVSEGQFGVMQAVQERLLPSLVCGATGVCATASNAYPHLYRRLYDTFQAGDTQKAYKLQNTMRVLLNMYKASSGPKHILNRLGLPISTAARHTREITEEQDQATNMLVAFVKEELSGK